MLNFAIPWNAVFGPLRSSESRLVTGLQNQIRVQFSAIGHPVIGDRKYHQRKRRSGELPASLFMQRIFSSFIHARETASPLTANSPRTFSLFFRLYRRPNVRAGKFSEALRTEPRSPICADREQIRPSSRPYKVGIATWISLE